MIDIKDIKETEMYYTQEYSHLCKKWFDNVRLGGDILYKSTKNFPILDKVPTLEELSTLKKQNESLQAELDKEIKINRKLVKALKRYADPHFYDIVEDSLDEGEMISEDSEIDLDLVGKYISTCGIPVGSLAVKTLKEIGEEE